MGEEEDISTAYQLSHLSHLQLVGGGGWGKKYLAYTNSNYILDIQTASYREYS